MADLSVLQKSLDRIKSRTMGAFIYDDAAATPGYRAFGIFETIDLTGESVKSNEDVARRQKTVGFLVKGSFVVQQSTAEDIAAGAAVAQNLGASGNGSKIVFTEKPVAPADVDAETDKYTFENVLLGVGFTLKGKSGDQSMVSYDFQGFVPVEQVVSLDTTRTFTFDV